VKARFKAALRENNQNVTGFLQRSISSTKFESSLRMRSFAEGDILSEVIVSIDIPWGRYGRELDYTAGAGAIDTPPDREFIEDWIQKKRIPTRLEVKATLKGGRAKTYTYVNTRSSRSAMAYHIVKNIASEQEVRTRYDYVADIEFDFQVLVEDAVNEFYEEQALDFLGDVFVEIDNIF
jgi:hypothetical protein